VPRVCLLPRPERGKDPSRGWALPLGFDCTFTLATAVLSAPSPSHQSAEFFADSLQTFGFTNPVLIGDDDEIIAGHGRVEAAKLLRMESEIN
jgi:hypothetical protein